jgi:hypothetical protein
MPEVDSSTPTLATTYLTCAVMVAQIKCGREVCHLVSCLI